MPTREEAGWCRAQVERFLKDNGGLDPREAALRTNVHLRNPSLMRPVNLPAIVNVVSDILGADLLCRSSRVFLKTPRDPAYAAWHQDAA